MRAPEWTPRISLGDMLTLGVTLVAVTLYGAAIQADVRVQASRIDSVQAEQTRLKQDVKESEDRTQTALVRIEAGMLRIEDKLDRKADK